MDSFLRLYAIYRSVSRWRIIMRVYSDSEIKWRVVLWASKLAFAVLAAIGFMVSPWHPFFLAMVIVTATWAWAFSKARSAVFSEFYCLYPERIKYFEKDYQYIRYLAFRKSLESGSFAGSVIDALTFIDGQIESDSRSPASSHTFISFSLASLLAIVGGAAGQWSVKYTVIAIFILVVILYFSYMIFGITRTPQSDLKEFKRFLLWVKDEQPET